MPEGLGPIRVGQRVEVPFGKSNKLETGFCVRAEVPAGESFGGQAGGAAAQVRGARHRRGAAAGRSAHGVGQLDRRLLCLPAGAGLAAMVPGAVKRAAGIKKRRYVYLGPAWEEMASSLKGPKQKGIVAVLRERGAFTADAAVEVAELLETVGCGQPAVKHLADGQIVRVVQKKVFRQFARCAGRDAGGGGAGDHVSTTISSGRWSTLAGRSRRGGSA